MKRLATSGARKNQRAEPELMIDIVVASPRWKTSSRASAIIREAIAAAAQATSISRAELAIVLTDDSAIRALNRQWRGLDTPTNVLSFPSLPSAQAGRGRRVDTRAAVRRNAHLGDIIIAHQTLAREAKAEHKPFRHHLAHLAVHGYLHLVGYDHENDEDADQMERLEARILARLGVPDPYTRRLPASRQADR